MSSAENISLTEVRIGKLETSVAEVLVMLRTHDLALFGGYDHETGQRQIGVFEQLSEAVAELKRISATLNKTFSFVEGFVKGLVFWMTRLSLLFISGLGTLVWFLVTHWASLSHAFQNLAR